MRKPEVEPDSNKFRPDDPFAIPPGAFETMRKMWEQAMDNLAHMPVPEPNKKERILHVFKAVKADMEMLEQLINEL